MVLQPVPAESSESLALLEAIYVPFQGALFPLLCGFATSGMQPLLADNKGWQSALNPQAPLSGWLGYAPVLGRGGAWQQSLYTQPVGSGQAILAPLVNGTKSVFSG